ncbi:hypothetical protein V6N13_104616 [Hibiscus sabdariffa]
MGRRWFLEKSEVSAANGYLWRQFGNKLKALHKDLATVKTKKPTSTVRVGRSRFEVGDDFGANAIKLGITDAACGETMVPSDVANKDSGFLSLGGEEMKVANVARKLMDSCYFVDPDIEKFALGETKIKDNPYASSHTAPVNHPSASASSHPTIVMQHAPLAQTSPSSQIESQRKTKD